MLANGINLTADLSMESDGSYRVELCRIHLPHLPLTREQLATINRNKNLLGELGPPPMHLGFRELKASTQRWMRVTKAVMRISRISASFEDGAQVIRGHVSSVGPSPNLATYLRDEHPSTLVFTVRGKSEPHPEVTGAEHLTQLVTWDIIPYFGKSHD